MCIFVVNQKHYTMQALSKILRFLVNVLFLTFGGKVKGARTAIVGVVASIIAVWTFINEQQVFALLCELASSLSFLSMFCEIESTKFWGVLLAVFSAINLILKKLDADDLVGLLPGEIGAEHRAKTKVYDFAAIIGGALLVVLLGWAAVSGQWWVFALILAFAALNAIGAWVLIGIKKL